MIFKYWRTSTHEKIIILIPVIVAIIPILYFGGIIPFTSHSHIWPDVMDHRELLEKSPIVVVGKIVDSQVQVEFFENNEMVLPEITTLWALRVDEMIKGEELTEMQFVTDGGKYNNMVATVDGLKIVMGDELLVFLSKDIDSIYGNNYYVTGTESDMYRINGDIIKNDYLKKTFDLTEFKEELKK